MFFQGIFNQLLIFRVKFQKDALSLDVKEIFIVDLDTFGNTSKAISAFVD